MADFELNIATDQFKKVGFEFKKFDREKFRDLIGMLATRAVTYKKPTVHLAPWAPLLARTKLGTVLRILNPRQRRFGDYDNKTAEIYVYARSDVEETNNTLLHETKHWGDDIAGLLPDTREVHKKTLKRMAPWAGGALALDAIVPVATYAITESESVAQWALIATGALTTMGLTSVKHRVAYENSEWEQRARDFAVDPTVLAQFGTIISA